MSKTYAELLREARETVPQTAPAAAAERAATGALMLDVREPHEWEGGHLPGALFVPLGRLEERITLAAPDKLHALGPWYAVEQSYDGKTYRSYVNGVLQDQADIAFRPQGPGHASVGVRMTHVNYFHGAVLEARFTPHALTPEEFLKVPPALAAAP